MNVSIDKLRSAVKSVLPLASESYRATGTGVFVQLNNSMWIVAGNFNGRLAGARVCDEIDEDLIDNYFSISDLHQYLTASFSSEEVSVKFDGRLARIVFSIGRNKRSFTYDPVASITRFIDIPPLSSGFVVHDMKLFQAVANAAHTDRANKLSGVLVRADEVIEIAATDSFLFGYASIKNELAQRFSCLIPADFLTYVGRVYWETPPRMAFQKNKIHFYSDDFFAIGSTIRLDGHPAEQVANVCGKFTWGHAATVDALDFVDKIGALVGIDNRTSGPISVGAITLSFDDEAGELHLLARSSESGEGEFFIPAHGLTHHCILNGHLCKKTASLLREFNGTNLLFCPSESLGLIMAKLDKRDDIMIGMAPMAH